VKPQAKCRRTSARRPTRGNTPLAIYEKSSATDWLSSQKRTSNVVHASPDGRTHGRLKQTALSRVVKRGERRRREAENAGRTKRTMSKRKRDSEATADVRSAR